MGIVENEKAINALAKKHTLKRSALERGKLRLKIKKAIRQGRA